jgi:hypothetical protein
MSLIFRDIVVSAFLRSNHPGDVVRRDPMFYPCCVRISAFSTAWRYAFEVRVAPLMVSIARWLARATGLSFIVSFHLALVMLADTESKILPAPFLSTPRRVG